MKRTFLAIVALMALSGCGNQPTFKYLPTDVAIDKHVHILGSIDGGHTIARGFNTDIFISCVDGKSTDNPMSIHHERFPIEAEVGPGRHSLGVVYTQGRSYAVGAIWIDTEPGHTYQLKQRSTEQNRIFVWAVDNQTLATTGGPLGTQKQRRPIDEACGHAAFTPSPMIVPVP